MKSKELFTKSVSFLLLAILLCSSLLLVSCKTKDRKYNEEEVAEAARDLIFRSILLNEIYYGYGIPVLNDLSEANGNYYPADPVFLRKNGFTTVEELKRMTEAVFTRALCESIYQTKFSSVSDGDGIKSFSRYYQKYEDAAQTIPVTIMVNTEAEVFLIDRVIYDFESLAVEGAEGEKVYVRMNAKAENAEGEVQESILRGALIEEENGWRLDSPTYRRYNPDLERYNDLKNK